MIRDCVVMTKLDPFGEWTPYKWGIHVGKDFNKESRNTIDDVPDELLPSKDVIVDP